MGLSLSDYMDDETRRQDEDLKEESIAIAKPYWKQVFERHESDILIFIGLLIFVWTSGIGIYLHSRLQHQRCIEALKDAKDGIIIMSLCQ